MRPAILAVLFWGGDFTDALFLVFAVTMLVIAAHIMAMHEAQMPVRRTCLPIFIRQRQRNPNGPGRPGEGRGLIRALRDGPVGGIVPLAGLLR